MRVLSWNLFGLEPDQLDVRTEAALFIALLGGRPEDVLDGRPLPPPDVLMFQEVVDRTFHAHLRPHLAAAGYTLIPAAPPEREYFEVLAVRAPAVVLDSDALQLESDMGRTLLVATARRDGVTWLLMTAHLESLSSGAPLRMEQARFVLELLGNHDGPAVFGGDTNLRMDEAASLGVPLDAWEASGSDPAARWTWSKRSYRARYDRIWGRGVLFSGFRCLGTDPVTPDGQPPSDHLGIVVDARLTG